MTNYVECGACIIGTILLCLAKCGLNEGTEPIKIAILAIVGALIPAIIIAICEYRKGWKW